MLLDIRRFQARLLRISLHSTRRFLSVASLFPLPLGSVDRRSLIAGCREEKTGGRGERAPTRQGFTGGGKIRM